MRIIGGKYGRRIIKTPNNLPVRPTTDLAKEGLFNILNNKIDFQNKIVLDLFSGTGAISYEFISRNCEEVTSVEMNSICHKFIKETSEKFGMENHKIIRSEVFKFLKSHKKPYDIIFADPPYAMPDFLELADLIFKNNLLKKDGLLIIEHPIEVDFSNKKYFFERRKYSKVNFSIFIYTADKQSNTL